MTRYLELFLASTVVLPCVLGPFLVQASDYWEIRYSPDGLRYDEYLPLLVRGGSLNARFYENITRNDDAVFLDAGQVDRNYVRAGQLVQNTMLQAKLQSLGRRLPENQRLPESDPSEDSELCLSYTDILQCKSPRWTRQADAEMSPPGGDGSYNANLKSSKDFPNARTGKMEGTDKLSHSPVVYQYYARSRMRGNPSQSLHFILLGPNVDHWKAVGQILASRGFNTIACERVPDGKIDQSNDSPNLVLDVLDALRWNKAVLVGCDREAILAMETAMMLAPDRVAGMVLSGDLAEASRVASEAGVDVLDAFLKRILDCPYLIVWDGDSPSIVSGSSAHDAMASDSNESTCQILGGGSAPHRTKAEQFAWVLTRFVQEKLEIPSQKVPRVGREDWRTAPRVSNQRQTGGRNALQRINLPFGINTLVSPEGRLLLGRAVAAGIFYITMMKVAVIQYGILRAGLVRVKSKYDSVDAVVKKIFQATAAFILNFGYIPRLFRVKKAAEDYDDDRENSIMPSSQDSDEEETDATEESDSDPGETDIGNEAGEDDSDETSPPEEYERPRFKPFFFLDSVVT